MVEIRGLLLGFIIQAHLWFLEMENYVVSKRAALFTSTIMSKLLALINLKLLIEAVVDLIICAGNRVWGWVINCGACGAGP